MQRSLICLIAASLVACGGSESPEPGEPIKPVSTGTAGTPPSRPEQAGTAGAKAGTGGSELGGAGGSGGAPVDLGGAAGERPDSAGTGGADAVAGAGGTAGSEPIDTVDECAIPPDAATLHCDNLCGDSDPGCEKCRPAYQSAGFITLGGEGNATNQDRGCGCGEATMALVVGKNHCAKFTVQPGATASFSVNSCDSFEQAQCLIVMPLVEGTFTDINVYVSRPSTNAWVHQQVADRLGDKCPLYCP